MRSISSAIISLTCWYMLTNMNDKADGTRVFLALMSFMMLAVAFVLLIFGL
jgi:hypothetical protein